MLTHATPSRGLILIIDDSIPSIHALSGGLGDLAEILFATDGERGIRLARESHPDLILLDVEMPGVDGFGVCRRLKADPATCGCTVIFVTAHNDSEREISALAAGAVDFIAKPVNMAVARARVIAHLRLKQQTDALERMHDDLQAILDNMPAMIGYWSSDLRNRFGNQAYLDWFGRRPEDVCGAHLEELLGQGLYQESMPRIQEVLAGQPQFFEQSVTTPSGGVRCAQVSFIPDQKDGETEGFFVLATDITARKQAEMALRDEKEALRVTLNAIGDAVVVTDRAGMVNFMNGVAEELTGWSMAEASGRPIEEVMDLRDAVSRSRVTNPIRFALREDRAVGMAINSVLVRRDGAEYSLEDSAAPICDESGTTSGAIIAFHDVSEVRRLALKMAHLSQHDALTDLPNKALLNDRVRQAVHAAERTDAKFALMILDLDHFKYVNDSLGHAVGDELLRAIAIRLAGCLRAVDTVSRRGGDEFIILLPQVASTEAVAQLADKLIDSVSTNYEIAGTRLQATFSMGICVFPDDGRDHETLLRNADAAMYRAKQSGRNRYQFYSADIGDLILARHALEKHLRQSLDQGAFSVFYQPKIDARQGRLIGVEALVRWHDHNGDLVSPAGFIPLAEETGLIVPLGKYVLLEACRQCRRWLEMGIAPLRIAVNISAAQFAATDFTEMVQTILAEAGLQPSSLELEITEGTMLIDTDHTRRVLGELKHIGISVAIDDFGTGYSSLSYLKRFPVDVLKVDQSFVRDLLTDSNDAAIVAAIVSLSRSLGLQLVAEGVEREEQVERLMALGCDVMQGFLFAHPMPAETASGVLQHWTGRTVLPGD